MNKYNLEAYNFTLPEELIGQDLASPPDSCRLLVYKKTTQTLTDWVFTDLPWLLPKHSSLFFNNSKVLKARILLNHIPGREQQEIFFLHVLDTYRFEALVWPWKKFKPWTVIQYNDTIQFTIESVSIDWRIIRCNQPILETLDRIGQMAIPAYIDYKKEKELAYQPLFAQHPWSVAAPTASLHFTPRILKQLEQNNINKHTITLHIWLWTFKPVDNEYILDHKIHTEKILIKSNIFEIIAQHKSNKQPIIAVWTTVTRTLETLPYFWLLLSDTEKKQCSAETLNRRNNLTDSLAQRQAHNVVQEYHMLDQSTRLVETKLFLHPWESFHIIDWLLTNFHTPKSTLLMLVAWFIWLKNMQDIYQHAITTWYKFYSFGDAQLLLP